MPKEEINRRINIFKILFIVITIFFNFLTASANSTLQLTAEEKDWLENHRMIRIAVMNYWDSDDDGNSMHTDFLKLLNKYGDLNIVPVRFDKWNDGFSEAIEGDGVHGIMNLSWSKEREEKYFYYTQAYGYKPNNLVVRKTDNSINSLKDLHHKTVYVKKQSITKKILQNESSTIKIIELDNNEELFKLLDSKTEAAASLIYKADPEQLEKYNLKVAKKVYGKYAEFYIGVAHKHKILRSIINKAMNKVPKIELNNIQSKIYKKTIKNNLQLIELSKEEINWIKKHPIIKVGGELDWAPFDFVDENGAYNGLAKDYLEQFSKMTGLKFHYETGKSWYQLLNALKEGSIDMLPALYINEDRKKYTNFTKAYLNLSEYIFTRSDTKNIHDLKELYGKTVALVKGYDIVDWIKKEHPKIKVIEKSTILECLKSVQTGKSIAFIGDNPSTTYNIRSNFITNIIINSVVEERKPIKLYMGTKSDYEVLSQILNKAIDSLSKEQKQKIFSKWVSVSKLQGGVEDNFSASEISFAGLLTKEEIIFTLMVILIISLFVYKFYIKGTLLNVGFKSFNLTIVFLELFMISFLIYEIVLLDRMENNLAKSYAEKLDMLQVAHRLMQSSDDLTHFARTYAVTKKKQFEKMYRDTLDIRNGKIKRPIGYNSGIYWNLSPEIRQNLHPKGEAISLKDMIKELPFSRYEQEKLKESEDNSNSLLQLEIKAFEALKNGDQALAIELLHSDEYYIAKQQIMLPVDEMISLLNKRTSLNIEYLNKKISKQFIYLFAAAILFILGNILLYFMLNKKVNIPIRYLTNIINKIKNNDKELIKKEFFKDEIGDTIEQFFIMYKQIKENEIEINRRSKELEYSKRSTEQILANVLLPIFITSKKRRVIVYANKFSSKLYEKTIDEMIGSKVDDIYSLEHGPEEIIYQLKTNGKVESFETKVITSTGKDFDALLSVTPINYQGEECYIGMTVDISHQKQMENEIREVHKNTKDSIEYAALIQHAIIPDNDLFREYFSDYFAIWHPKDIVGGDVYLFEELRHKDECLIMCIDCTGHGVPGAFVTMLVKAIERQVAAIISSDPSLEVSPAWILQYFNKMTKKLLKQESNESVSNAGFDGGVIYFNKKNMILKFAGAQTPLFYFDKNNELKTIKGDRHSIGYRSSVSSYEFTEHTFNVEKGMTFYITTDGYIDQNGGAKGFPFGKKRFKAILEEYHEESFADQQEVFLDTLQEYQGQEDRNDDITLLGIKI